MANITVSELKQLLKDKDNHKYIECHFRTYENAQPHIVRRMEQVRAICSHCVPFTGTQCTYEQIKRFKIQIQRTKKSTQQCTYSRADFIYDVEKKRIEVRKVEQSDENCVVS